MRFCNNMCWLAFALILFVFGNSWEPGVGLDTATYGAIAREMLESGAWFHPKLAPGIFDPFVEHPYLVLWLDAISIKLLGATAQGIHFTSSALGILGVLAFYASIRRLFDENTAFLTALCLLLINVFMNFMSSGWLDMPMVAFTLIAFYFSTQVANDNASVPSILTGLFLSLAVLAKGAAALGIFPVALFVMLQQTSRPKALLFLALGFLTPLAVYTLAHYQASGFLFWKPYLERQFSVHNDIRESVTDPVGWIWYIRDTITHAHIISLLFIPGIYLMWRRHHRAIALTVLLEFLLHFLAYACSHRHNRQYLVPIFPWLALGAGYLISQRWKIAVPKWSQGLFYFGVTYFFAVSFFPITIHNVGGAEIYALASDVKNSPIQNIYFKVTAEDRISGEMTSSYIAWYLNKVPVMMNIEDLPQTFANLKDVDAILLRRNKETDIYLENPETICAWNDSWLLLSTKETCDSLDRKKRLPSPRESLAISIPI